MEHKMQDIILAVIRLISICFLFGTTEIHRETLYLSRHSLWLENKAKDDALQTIQAIEDFFHACIASSKHKGSWENLRQYVMQTQDTIMWCHNRVYNSHQNTPIDQWERTYYPNHFINPDHNESYRS